MDTHGGSSSAGRNYHRDSVTRVPDFTGRRKTGQSGRVGNTEVVETKTTSSRKGPGSGVTQFGGGGRSWKRPVITEGKRVMSTLRCE